MLKVGSKGAPAPNFFLSDFPPNLSGFLLNLELCIYHNGQTVRLYGNGNRYNLDLQGFQNNRKIPLTNIASKGSLSQTHKSMDIVTFRNNQPRGQLVEKKISGKIGDLHNFVEILNANS